MSSGSYLDYARLDALDPRHFQTRAPFPWLNEAGLLGESGFRALRESLPRVEQFEKRFGHERKFGQMAHDRYALEYSEELEIEKPWHDFVAELRGPRYRTWLAGMLGTKHYDLSFHWHYTPSGRGVSPHCDSPREHGSHLFYFNSEEDWDPSWGGNTLVLDDGGRLDYNTAPSLEQFDRVIECDAFGNASALLKRDDHGWHAVRPVDCPEGKLRRVFIVVVNPNSLYWRVRDKIVGKKIQRF